jgi:hypothetical protein
MFERHLHVIVPCALLLAGCGRVASGSAQPPAFDPTLEARCTVTKSPTEPLIVEWPGAARAKLEARARKGLVATTATRSSCARRS